MITHVNVDIGKALQPLQRFVNEKVKIMNGIIVGIKRHFRLIGILGRCITIC